MEYNIEMNMLSTDRTSILVLQLLLGKTKLKSLELLLLKKTVHQRQYCILHYKTSVGISESSTNQDLKDPALMLHNIYSLSSNVWPWLKTDASAKITMSFHKFTQVVAPNAAALPDVFAYINTSSNT
jgi:hypothetical protein